MKTFMTAVIMAFILSGNVWAHQGGFEPGTRCHHKRDHNNKQIPGSRHCFGYGHGTSTSSGGNPDDEDDDMKILGYIAGGIVVLWVIGNIIDDDPYGYYLESKEPGSINWDFKTSPDGAKLEFDIPFSF